MAGEEQADLPSPRRPRKGCAPLRVRSSRVLGTDSHVRVPPSVLAIPGAFGENLSTSGVTEADVYVGDVWRAGTALLQVSQGRQPCFKLNQRFELADMARRVQSSGRTGWYYQVVQPGTIGLGDPLRLVERTHFRWPLSRLLRVFYVDRLNRSELE